MITVIANLKGGTGKSTVTFNLALWLLLNGRQVKVIDVDPQRSLSDVAEVRQEQKCQPELEVRTGPLLDKSLLEPAGDVLVDVGTSDMEMFKLALMIADRVVIPVCPSQADVWSTQRFMILLNEIRGDNPLEALAVVNRADTSRGDQAAEQAAIALKSLAGVQLLPCRLSYRRVFRDSFSEGLAAFELEPRSKGSAELRELASTLFEGEMAQRQGDTGTSMLSVLEAQQSPPSASPAASTELPIAADPADPKTDDAPTSAANKSKKKAAKGINKTGGKKGKKSKKGRKGKKSKKSRGARKLRGKAGKKYRKKKGGK